VGNERPPFEDSPSAGDWLQAAYPRHKQPDMREATPEEVRLIEDYAAVRLLERELEVGEKKLVSQIKLAIADKEGLTFPGGKFTWRRTKDQEEINWEGLVYTLMHLHVPAKADRDKLYADHTTLKEGTRRIRIDHPSLKKEKESAADAA
jgi:hypothetical protein